MDNAAQIKTARELIQQMLPMMLSRAESNFRKADNCDRKNDAYWAKQHRGKAQTAEHWIERAEAFLQETAQ